MKNRLESILEYYKINSSKLADILSVQRSGISHILSGRNNPSYDFLVSLLEAFPEINAKWLMQGKGEMIDEEDIDDSNVSDSNNFDNRLNLEIEENTNEDEQNIDKTQDLIDNEGYMSKQSSLGSSKVEKVIILYSDGNFQDYHKE